MRGNTLEKSIAAAAVHYQRAGKADVKKQHTQRVGPQARWAGKSPIDFKGVVKGGKMWALECKECAGTSFALSYDHLSLSQRQALDRHVELGAETYLVVSMVAAGETFLVPWSEVQRFIAAPWRHSLSMQWLQANGLLLPVSDGATWFLDGKNHPLKGAAYLAVVAEKAKSPLVDLDKPTEKVQAPTQRLTKEQRIAGVRAAVSAYKPKRKTMWGK